MIDGTVSNGKLFEDCFGSETHVDECHPREWCHIDQTNIGAGSRTDGSPEYHIRHVVTASRDCLHPSSSLIHAYAQHSSSTHTSCPQHTLLRLTPSSSVLSIISVSPFMSASAIYMYFRVLLCLVYFLIYPTSDIGNMYVIFHLLLICFHLLLFFPMRESCFKPLVFRYMLSGNYDIEILPKQLPSTCNEIKYGC